MSFGTFYGVGVGPGASDLMTVRAVRVINKAHVLAIPKAGKFSKSFAWRIAEPNLEQNEAQERLFQLFPMTKDPAVLLPAWQKAVDEIVERLKSGKDVAFLTQGDPMIYSTFIYIKEMVEEEMPEASIEIVPAVTTIAAVPSVSGRSLVDGQESLAVIPATYGVDRLKAIIDSFDTVVLMKVGSVVSTVKNILSEMGLLNKAYFCEKATGAEQRLIMNLNDLNEDRCAYFSTIIINKKVNHGVLSGKSKIRGEGANL